MASTADSSCSNPTCPVRSTTTTKEPSGGVKLLRCGACASVHYCCKECQRAHWKAGHKAQCKILKAQRDEANWQPPGKCTPPADGRCVLVRLPAELLDTLCRFLDAPSLVCLLRHVRKEAVTYRASGGSSALLQLQSMASTSVWHDLLRHRFRLVYLHLVRQSVMSSKTINPTYERSRTPFSTSTHDADVLGALDETGSQWMKIFQDFASSQMLCRVQVFNRETGTVLAGEFKMSCYEATATLRKKRGAGNDVYHVQYLDDGRGIITETVPEARCRPLPPDQTERSAHEVCISADPRIQSVLRDASVPLDSVFPKGTPVEIQWKKQAAHPFGWWYGLVDAVDQDTRAVRVVFDQYYQQSPWYSVTVTVGTTTPTRGMQGFLGGIRFPAEEDIPRWLSCMPTHKIL